MYNSLNVDLLYVFITVAKTKISVKAVRSYLYLNQLSAKKSIN